MKSRCSAIMELADKTYEQYKYYGDAVANAVIKSLEFQRDFIEVDVFLTKEEKSDMRLYVSSYIVSFYLDKLHLV
jgi:hypothetical protein